MRDAVIVEAVRTPVGKGKPSGALHGVHPADLFAHSLREVVRRSGIDPELIDDVIGGVVTAVGEQGSNLTRRAALAAGYPNRCPPPPWTASAAAASRPSTSGRRA